MRVASWNVNGIRSIAQKGFVPWLERSGADIVALQETRVRAEQLPPELRPLPGWHAHYVSAERPGYSGVAVLSRREPDELQSSLGIKTFDAEGRIAIARFGALHVVSGYFPNGSGQARDNSRVPYKLRFYRRLHKVLEPLKQAGAPVLVLGDFNTAPHEIDLARPKDNQKTSGFLPEERKELLHLVEPALRCARAQRGLAHRSGDGLTGRHEARARRGHRARRDGQRSLSDLRRSRRRGDGPLRRYPARESLAARIGAFQRDAHEARGIEWARRLLWRASHLAFEKRSDSDHLEAPPRHGGKAQVT